VRAKAVPLPRFEEGWVLVGCDADAITPVWISVGRGEFTAAFRDYYQGVRVAKVRHPALSRKTSLRLRVGDEVSPAGSITP
jgi:hypothetical protein